MQPSLITAQTALNPGCVCHISGYQKLNLLISYMVYSIAAQGRTASKRFSTRFRLRKSPNRELSTKMVSIRSDHQKLAISIASAVQYIYYYQSARPHTKVAAHWVYWISDQEQINKELSVANIRLSIQTLWQYANSKKVRSQPSPQKIKSGKII